jgi:hypothetical protein
MRKLIIGTVALAMLGLAGCATTTNGPTVPSAELTKLAGSPVLMNDPGVLTMYATTQCAVGAAQEYRLSVAACEGEFANIAGGAPIPTNAVAGINMACQVLGYTNASNQLIVPQTISVGPLTQGGPCMPTPLPANAPKLKVATE